MFLKTGYAGYAKYQRTMTHLLLPILSATTNPLVDESVPVLSQHAVWAGVMIQIVLFLFISAVVIGVMASIIMPPEAEPVAPAEDLHAHGH